MLQRSAWCEDTTVGRCVTLQTALQGVAWVALHPASSFIQREVNVRLQFDRAWAYCEKPAAPARVLVQKKLTNIFEWGWNHPLVFDCPTDCLLNGQLDTDVKWVVPDICLCWPSMSDFLGDEALVWCCLTCLTVLMLVLLRNTLFAISKKTTKNHKLTSIHFQIKEGSSPLSVCVA